MSSVIHPILVRCVSGVKVQPHDKDHKGDDVKVSHQSFPLSVKCFLGSPVRVKLGFPVMVKGGIIGPV